MEFWKDKSRNQLDPELFSKKAEEIAKEINAERLQSRGKANKPTQIRNFYEEVLRFDSMLKTSPGEFDNILPYLKMINAKVAYAVGRDLVTSKFKDFISNSLKQVKDKEDFNAFAGLFEAFMGYYKFYCEKKEQRQFSQGGRR